jgi:hypothetical protein
VEKVEDFRKSAWFFAALFALVAAARLAHSNILWAEEGLPLAAARHILAGRVLFRDIWFDKPPLLAWSYLAWAAQTGWILRLAGALYVTLASWIAWRFGRELWGPREGFWAAGLLAFFLTFDLPSAVMPLAADLLMLAPHLAAVWMAWRGYAFWSGLLAGVAFLINTKGLFVLAACALWLPHWRALPLLGLGFLAPAALGAAVLWWQGAFAAYVEEVWKWGRIYASGTFVAAPVRNGMERILHWAGFHAALVIGGVLGVRSEKQRWRFAGWALLSLAVVVAGWRFFPRYFFQLLPVAVIAAARALNASPRREMALVILLLVPLVRFGPQFATLYLRGPEGWRDVAMDRDSRRAAAMAASLTAPSDQIFVWGFRPELYVYSGRLSASRFLDSQPLTGVPADRHLTESKPVAEELARANRAELAGTRPALILDGLGLYNRALAINRYPDLEKWLAQYRVVGRTGTVIIYQLAR